MNIERWVAGRQVHWHKLEELLKQAEKKGLPSLSREDLQSLGRLYRSAASDLSRARVMGTGSDVTSYLNNLVVKGHNQVYQSPQSRLRDLQHFLWITFPANFRGNIIYVFVSFLFFVIPLASTWILILQEPRIAHMDLVKGNPIVSDELFSYVEKKQMWTDSVAGESPAASAFIATNNIKVSLIAFVSGIVFGLGTIFVLVNNGVLIGGTFAVCQLHGMVFNLLSFVAPHGVFELSSIFISGGAGLMLAKGLLFPGQYKRSDSLRLMAKEASLLFLGCVPLLLVAGLIEGFVSPRTDISPEYKFAVSVATLALFLLYMCVPRSAKTPESETNTKASVG